MNVTRRGVSVRVDVQRIDRDAVRILAGGSPPVGERWLNRSIEDADYPVGPSGVQIVVISGEPGRIGRCSANGDGNVSDTTASVAASVP